MQTERTSSRPRAVHVLAVVFFAAQAYSVYLALRLLFARCEGFSCTYLGVAWFFWIGVLCLPVTLLGYFLRRAPSLPQRVRTVLHFVWLAHTIFSVGLLIWWLLHRV